MSEFNQAIKGTTGKDAGFSVSFPSGVDGEPKIIMTNIAIDCDGDSVIYGALNACGNWFHSHVERMKSRPQVEYNVYDLIDDNNNVKDCRISSGEITPLSNDQIKSTTLTETNRLLNLECEELKGDVESLRECLNSMINAIDLIWIEQGFEQSQLDVLVNYRKSKELLDK